MMTNVQCLLSIQKRQSGYVKQKRKARIHHQNRSPKDNLNRTFPSVVTSTSTVESHVRVPRQSILFNPTFRSDADEHIHLRSMDFTACSNSYGQFLIYFSSLGESGCWKKSYTVWRNDCSGRVNERGTLRTWSDKMPFGYSATVK
jgi:hypothetical protein